MLSEALLQVRGASPSGVVRTFEKQILAGLRAARIGGSKLASSNNPRKRLEITLNVNGETAKVNVKANWTLAKVLREELGLTGVKMGCGLSACGACTVLVDDLPVYSCHKLAVELDGRNVTTIEGLGKESLHPLQRAFVDCGGVQCGYCTPGIILTAFSLLKTKSTPTLIEVKRALSGNICRCGGYPQIVQSVLSACQGGEMK